MSEVKEATDEQQAKLRACTDSILDFVFKLEGDTNIKLTGLFQAMIVTAQHFKIDKLTLIEALIRDKTEVHYKEEKLSNES